MDYLEKAIRVLDIEILELKRLRDRLSDVEKGRWRPASPLTFEEYAKTWLEQGDARRDWKPRTRKAYAVVVDRLSDTLGSKRLDALTPRDVAAYIARQTDDGLAPATVNRDVSILHDVLKVAVREELIESNPAAGAERPCERAHTRLAHRAGIEKRVHAHGLRHPRR